jgi:polyribonucleotide 5'-hydroxyl-kinase
LTKILSNYAVREGNTPLLVDLDIGQGMLTAPGTISSVLVEDVANIEIGSFSQENALSFFYGHASPSENIEHYKLVVERMAAVLESFLDSKTNSTAAASGLFVNTMGWIDGDGYNLLLHAIEKFNIDVVLVVGHDRLYSQLSTSCRSRQTAAGQQVQVVKLPKSGGVVTRDSSYRKTSREKSIHAYFYGLKRELSPFSRSVQISQLQVYRVGGGFKAPLSALPIGSTKQEDTMKVTAITITRELTHSLLAVSHCIEPGDLLHSNVAGFIHITEVDLQKGVVTYLSPSPDPLPSPVLIAGTIKCFLK